MKNTSDYSDLSNARLAARLAWEERQVGKPITFFGYSIPNRAEDYEFLITFLRIRGKYESTEKHTGH